MEEYKINIQRTYNTTILLKCHNNGKNHKKIIEDKIANKDQELWDIINKEELEQMDVSNETWEIQKIHETRTGALAQDIGPRN